MHGEGRAATEIGKSICVSAVFTLAAVLLFALFVKLFSLGQSVILPVNQVIKAVSVFLGCFLCIRGSRPVLKGMASGAGTALLTYFLFAAIAGSISFGWSNVIDFLFGAVAGGISGAIATLVRKK